MRPNCFYDTFFSSHKSLDKYNICAQNQYPPTLHCEVTVDLSQQVLSGVVAIDACSELETQSADKIKEACTAPLEQEGCINW